MADIAAFPKPILERIYGTYPRCLRCPNPAQDFHHIMGRGGKRDRKTHSSIYNAAPLCRACHDKGEINFPEVREKLLAIVWKIVNLSSHTDMENDVRFLEKHKRLYVKV